MNSQWLIMQLNLLSRFFLMDQKELGQEVTEIIIQLLRYEQQRNQEVPMTHELEHVKMLLRLYEVKHKARFEWIVRDQKKIQYIQKGCLVGFLQTLFIKYLEADQVLQYIYVLIDQHIRVQYNMAGIDEQEKLKGYEKIIQL